MANLTTQLGIGFIVPAAGLFAVTVTGGNVKLMRQLPSGGTFAVAASIGGNVAVDVQNSVAGSTWRFDAESGNPSVRADQ